MANKKQHILETSLALFVENAYENTPTSAISKAAQVATGTLFHHFKSKQQILDQLYIDCKQSLKTALSSNLQTAKDSRGLLFLMWFNYVKWATENPNMFKFLKRYSESTAISVDARAMVDNTYHELLQLIKKSKEDELLAKLPLEYLAMLTKLHFSTAADYCIAHPDTLQKKKLPKRLFEAYWKAISAK